VSMSGGVTRHGSGFLLVGLKSGESPLGPPVKRTYKPDYVHGVLSKANDVSAVASTCSMQPTQVATL